MDKVIVNLIDISDVKPGDLCYDKLLDSFFVAKASQIKDLKRRGISFWVVDHKERKLFAATMVSKSF